MTTPDVTALREEIKGLTETVNRLAEAVNKNHVVVVRQIAVCSACQPRVAEHDRALYGHNGNPGMVAHVQNSRRWWKWLWAFVGAMAAAVLALGVHAIKSMMGRG